MERGLKRLLSCQFPTREPMPNNPERRVLGSKPSRFLSASARRCRPAFNCGGHFLLASAFSTPFSISCSVNFRRAIPFWSSSLRFSSVEIGGAVSGPVRTARTHRSEKSSLPIAIRSASALSRRSHTSHFPVSLRLCNVWSCRPSDRHCNEFFGNQNDNSRTEICR